MIRHLEWKTLRYVSNISIISQEIFEHDPASTVEHFKVC